jgi:hypothetical protein
MEQDLRLEQHEITEADGKGDLAAAAASARAGVMLTTNVDDLSLGDCSAASGRL